MTYQFWIEMEDGKRLLWTGISRTAAKTMYTSTSKSCDINISAYGWKEA